MQESIDIQALNEQIKIESAFVDQLKEACGQVIVGQEYMVNRLILGLLAKGHVLTLAISVSSLHQICFLPILSVL